jgi:Outer membrane protein beta-barrel domain
MKTTPGFLIAALSVLFLSNNNYAQIFLGVQGGLSIPNISGGTNEISQGYTSRSAPNIGIFMEYQLSNNFSIQPEINYDGQGGQRNGLQPITNSELPPNPNGPYYYADFKNVSILNYLEIPVLLKYAFGGESIRFQVNLGPYVGFLLNAKEESSGTSLIYIDKNRTPLMVPLPPDYQQYGEVQQSFDATTNVYESLNKINFGAAGGIGLIYPLSATDCINFCVRFTYGFTNIQKYSEDGKNHTGNVVISVGYSRRIF